ncbi:MAG: hypothetical protein HXX09_16095 [Bacteroidetes bacterium]|nr:hypothetical protein [Bacteroidota bacterium]
MKKSKLFLIGLINLIFLSFVNAQENAFVSGNLDFLKQEKAFFIDFSYDQMAVGDFRTESDYIQKKVSEQNNTEPGKGDKWLVKWNRKKGSQFEPNFITYFNKKAKKIGVKVDSTATNSKYTILVKPYYLEEGWDVVVNSKPAIVRLQIIVFETIDKNKQIAEFRITGEYYKGGPMAGGALAFQEAGKTFAKFLIKTMKRMSK